MKKTDETSWDVIVVGGGPSGMMAAAAAAQAGASVLLLEKNSRLGKKLSITGGGRCNVTNNKPDVREMLKSYKEKGKFLFSTFSQHGVTESVSWFTERDVTLKEENEGRLFPNTDSAETIRETMVNELRQHNVTQVVEAIVTSIQKKEQHFVVCTAKKLYWETLHYSYRRNIASGNWLNR